AVSRMGLPNNAPHLPDGYGVHDILSNHAKTDTVAYGITYDAGWLFDLWHLSPTDAVSSYITTSHTMHKQLRWAILAALVPSLLIFAVLPSTAADSSADDNARFLAGIEPRANSPLAALARDAGWQQHARSFNAAWESLEARQLSKIRIWSAKNITR